MKIYLGRRDKNCNAIVRVVENGDSRQLLRRGDLANHSTGFNWGYGGSGPAQLALALLADALGNDELALQLHQKFKFHVIAQLPRLTGTWRLTDREIVDIALRLQFGTFLQKGAPP
jgi:hypothetical protein